MSAINPYQAPESNLESASTSQSRGDLLTTNAVDALIQTRPWVLFLAILGFVSVGFLVLGALLMLFAAIFGAAFGTEGSELGGIAGIGLTLLYLVVAAIYVIPCLFLLRYGIAIGRVQTRRDGESIEEALKFQKNFWKTVGIWMTVILGIYVVILVGAIVAGFVGALA